jgi:hypothetical protein
MGIVGKTLRGVSNFVQRFARAKQQLWRWFPKLAQHPRNGPSKDIALDSKQSNSSSISSYDSAGHEGHGQQSIRGAHIALGATYGVLIINVSLEVIAAAIA